MRRIPGVVHVDADRKPDAVAAEIARHLEL
jgi:hypothetical protein